MAKTFGTRSNELDSGCCAGEKQVTDDALFFGASLQLDRNADSKLVVSIMLRDVLDSRFGAMALMIHLPLL